MISILFTENEQLTSFGKYIKFQLKVAAVLTVVVAIFFAFQFEWAPLWRLIGTGLIIGLTWLLSFNVIGQYTNRYNIFYRKCQENHIEDVNLEKYRATLIKLQEDCLVYKAENTEDAYLIGKGVKSKKERKSGRLSDLIKEKKITIIIIVITCIIALFMAQADSGKRKWSDLSDEEKANAEFAYEVKQYQKEYEKNHKKK